MFRIPRIFGCTVERGFIGRAHSKLVHVGTTKRYHAFVEQVLDDSGSVGGDKVVQHFGAARAAPTCLAENIFVGDGYAGECSSITLCDTCVGGTGFGEGFILVEGDLAVDSRVLRSNGGEVFGCQFDGGDLFGLQQLAGLFEGVLGHEGLSVENNWNFKGLMVQAAF